MRRGGIAVILLVWAAAFQVGLSAQVPGNVWSWGDNQYGQLGNGTTTSSNVPIETSGAGQTIAVAAGGLHSLALQSDGTVLAWGNNDNGQLGDGTNTDRSLPVQVIGLTGITAVAGADENFSLALRNDGTVWAWGENSYGQLGNGSSGNGADRNVPVQVTGLTGAIAIAADYRHSLAVRNDGTVWAWGSNDSGQLGDGTHTDRATPVQVSGLAGVVAVAAGKYYCLALRNDGTVWAWGNNGYGQLGDGTTTNRDTPVQVSGLSGVVAVAAGLYHSLALTSEGTVWAWGDNTYGNLGIGTSGYSTSTDVAVAVSLPQGAVFHSIAGGGWHSLAIQDDGTLWIWGLNSFGQLGDGTTTDSSLPEQFQATGVISAIAGGRYHSLAVLSLSSCPAIALSPASLPDGAPGSGYQQTISASGGTGPYSYAVTSGVLPPGLSLSAGGVLSGTPSADGTYPFTVTATDASGCTGSMGYSVAITSTNVVPPAVTAGMKLGSPFRIVFQGSNLQNGIVVYINYSTVPWYPMVWKGTSKIVLKGGASLKAAVPKGVVTLFTFVNPDGGVLSGTWYW